MEKIEDINRRRMLNIAGQEGNTVYEYGFDNPERVADVEQAMKFAKLVFVERQKLTIESDAEAAVKLKEDNADLKVFSRTHPTIFSKMCAKATAPRDFSILEKLGNFGMTTSDMSLPQATARVSDFLMSQCARGPSSNLAPDSDRLQTEST